VERDNRLVALVKLDEETIEKGKPAIGNAEQGLSAIYAKTLTDIRSYVNSQVNKFSQLKGIEQISDLEKTASQKIKRFLYNTGSKGKVTNVR